MSVFEKVSLNGVLTVSYRTVITPHGLCGGKAKPSPGWVAHIVPTTSQHQTTAVFHRNPYSAFHSLPPKYGLQEDQRPCLVAYCLSLVHLIRRARWRDGTRARRLGAELCTVGRPSTHKLRRVCLRPEGNHANLANKTHNMTSAF